MPDASLVSLTIATLAYITFLTVRQYDGMPPATASTTCPLTSGHMLFFLIIVFGRVPRCNKTFGTSRAKVAGRRE